MHPTIQLGTLSIPAFGACILAGTILAFILLAFIRRFSDLTEENTLDAIIWAIILGFIGAKLLYFVTDPPAWPKTWADFVTILTSGMVFYGGLVGGVAAIALVAWRKKKNFFAFTDLLAPVFCLSHMGGRVGCIMAGCCYGMESTGFCTLVYPDGVSRLAVPLLEAIFLLLLSGVLVWILIKQKKRATVTGWYLILYAVWRFVIEFFRGDEIRGFIGGTLSTSQFISIPILLAGLLVLYFNRNNILIREPAPEADASEEPAAAPEEALDAAEAPEETADTTETADEAVTAPAETDSSKENPAE